MAAKTQVMIVDDANMMRLIIGNLLTKDPKFEVVASCANGKEALDKLKTTNPDIILLDIEMPEMDGLTFLRHARLRTRAKIIVLSSVTAAGSPKAAKAKKLGADAVIAKPSGAVSFDLEKSRGGVIHSTIKKLLAA